MLTIGLLGDEVGTVAERLKDLDSNRCLIIIETPNTNEISKCGFILRVGSRQGDFDPYADACIDNPHTVDDIWRGRILPFALNIAAGRRAPRRQQPRLADPDPSWPTQATRLITRLKAAAVDLIERADHIGSTSVAGLPAKDLIDIQVVVADLDTAAHVAEAVQAVGFVRVSGPLMCVDHEGQRHPEHVVVDADPGRPVNVNIRPINAPIWLETLIFRDWLRANPDAQSEYLALKRRLAARPGHDVNDYGTDKIPWIAAANERAERWAHHTAWTP